ncbi:hypothetical protein [Noviherbaspirillum malthae]|uniref:hypothetical protein n=1 Tax=Noviherbaspirillum malthae TaxID=1260987 RepID=UPI00188DE214|nr:hypothetical protein [Noviherbaspirillum malthae]
MAHTWLMVDAAELAFCGGPVCGKSQRALGSLAQYNQLTSQLSVCMALVAFHNCTMVG